MIEEFAMCDVMIDAVEAKTTLHNVNSLVDIPAGALDVYGPPLCYGNQESDGHSSMFAAASMFALVASILEAGDEGWLAVVAKFWNKLWHILHGNGDLSFAMERVCSILRSKHMRYPQTVCQDLIDLDKIRFILISRDLNDVNVYDQIMHWRHVTWKKEKGPNEARSSTESTARSSTESTAPANQKERDGLGGNPWAQQPVKQKYTADRDTFDAIIGDFEEYLQAFIDGRNPEEVGKGQPQRQPVQQDTDSEEERWQWSNYKGGAQRAEDSARISVDLGDFCATLWLANVWHMEYYWRKQTDSSGHIIGVYIALWLGVLYNLPHITKKCVPHFTCEEQLYEDGEGTMTELGHHVSIAMVPYVNDEIAQKQCDDCNHILRTWRSIRPDGEGPQTLQQRLDMVDKFFKPKLFQMYVNPTYDKNQTQLCEMHKKDYQAVRDKWQRGEFVQYDQSNWDDLESAYDRVKSRYEDHCHRAGNLHANFKAYSKPGFAPVVVVMKGRNGTIDCNIEVNSELADLLFWTYEHLVYARRKYNMMPMNKNYHMVFQHWRWHVSQQPGKLIQVHGNQINLNQWKGWDSAQRILTDPEEVIRKRREKHQRKKTRRDTQWRRS